MRERLTQSVCLKDYGLDEEDMAPQNAMKALTARCHCKAIEYSIDIPESALPLPVHLCHCSICRHTHGTLCVFHAPLGDLVPYGIDPKILRRTNKYQSTPTSSARYFCSTCGAHICDRSFDTADDDRGVWTVSTSLFTEHGEDVFKISSHIHTAYIMGSGLFDLVPKIGHRVIPMTDRPISYTLRDNFEHDENKMKEEGSFMVESGGHYAASGKPLVPGKLMFWCHCHEVKLEIEHPTKSPSGSKPRYRDKCIAGNRGSVTFRATLDVSDASRLTTGAHVAGWMYVPLAYIEDSSSTGPLHSPVEYRPGGLKRRFCQKCGATVMKVLDVEKDDKTGRIDGVAAVAVGLQHVGAPRDLVMGMKEWVTWSRKLEGEEEGMAFDPVFTQALKEGLEKWHSEPKEGDYW